MALWVCPPLFFPGETMLLGCWLLCYKTVFHSTATSLKPFNTHCWLVQTPSPFPLNHPHRIWPPFLRNDLRKMSPYLSCMCMCAHGHRHVCMHTQVFVYTHTHIGERVWIPPPLTHYKPGAFLGLCQWADANRYKKETWCPVSQTGLIWVWSSAQTQHLFLCPGALEKSAGTYKFVSDFP